MNTVKARKSFFNLYFIFIRISNRSLIQLYNSGRYINSIHRQCDLKYTTNKMTNWALWQLNMLLSSKNNAGQLFTISNHEFMCFDRLKVNHCTSIQWRESVQTLDITHKIFRLCANYDFRCVFISIVNDMFKNEIDKQTYFGTKFYQLCFLLWSCCLQLKCLR